MLGIGNGIGWPSSEVGVHAQMWAQMGCGWVDAIGWGDRIWWGLGVEWGSLGGFDLLSSCFLSFLIPLSSPPLPLPSPSSPSRDTLAFCMSRLLNRFSCSHEAIASAGVRRVHGCCGSVAVAVATSNVFEVEPGCAQYAQYAGVEMVVGDVAM
jgi:hypothetical protein